MKKGTDHPFQNLHMKHKIFPTYQQVTYRNRGRSGSSGKGGGGLGELVVLEQVTRKKAFVLQKMLPVFTVFSFKVFSKLSMNG